MNARHTITRQLRATLDETAARFDALLETLSPGHHARLQPVPVPVTPSTGVQAPRPFVLARRFAFVAALAAASLAGTAHASYRDDYVIRPDVWADGNLVDVQIQVDGDAAPLYLSPRGDRRHYFEAFAGRNYAVVLRNNSARRVGVLLAVDGLNVVNGEITKQSPNEPMYVLGPWESATIRGWRSSMHDVRRFVFVDEKRSYAERTGQANSDMGWIRVLAFREQASLVKFWSRNDARDAKRPQPWEDGLADRAKGEAQDESEAPEAAPRSEAPRSNFLPAPTARRQEGGVAEKQMSSRESAKDQGSFPGTGWGDRANDRVHYVDFTPQRSATDLILFRYEYARGLLALGIVPQRDRLRERDGGGTIGFARPPRR